MKNLLLLYIICYPTWIIAQPNQKAFSFLTKIDIGESFELMQKSISFVPSNTTVINKRLNELDPSDPFYMGECDGYFIKTIITRIDAESSQEYVFVYNDFDCASKWGFTIYKKEDSKNEIAYIEANQIYIPGNGLIYTINHMGTEYLVRKKFKLLDGDSLVEVKQPFNYVGIHSKTLRPIKIYEDKGMTHEIASLPKGYEVEVLLADEVYENIHYLVKTSFGLVGWTTLKAGQSSSIDIDGLYWIGN